MIHLRLQMLAVKMSHKLAAVTHVDEVEHISYDTTKRECQMQVIKSSTPVHDGLTGINSVPVNWPNTT